jgi:hypothetical protein
MEIDFITALGRLLGDGRLRSAFALDPRAVAAQLQLAPKDWPGWLALAPAELELQARILLRKRLALVRPLLPATTQRLGDALWPGFLECARNHWPAKQRPALDDARRFCRWLRQKNENLVLRSEWNRLQFSGAGKFLALHWLARETTSGWRWPGLQILFRISAKCSRELMLGFGF